MKDSQKTSLIYNATLQLVKERGIAGITMSDISRAASIATGTLYIYFKSKDELVKALFSDCRDRAALHYFEGLDSCHSFEEKMQKVFTNIITYKMAFFETAVFLEQSYHSPYVCIKDLKKKEKSMQPLYDLMEEGIEKKHIKNTDPELIVSFLRGIIQEMVKKTYFSRKKLSPETIAQLYDLFWDGIRLRQ